MAESSPKMGNYYAPGDYAGFLLRFAILMIDLFIVLAVFIAVKVYHSLQPEEAHSMAGAEFLGWAAFLFVYFVVLEASPLGTLGYLLTGVKIVTLEGERPSLLRMTLRLLLLIRGPLVVMFDLLWLTGDDYKQTLRDKFAGTVVIRKKAVPAGTGEIRLNRYQMLGYSFVFFEVRKP